jgi:photosystem II stability/assembly factor-like uncharacterized protein
MRALASLALLLALPQAACAQSEAEVDEGVMTSGTFSAFELRNIGPAFMSGRIADIEIHPDDPATWFVGVGSGGVWRTENAGTTWTPIFDDQTVYSIGDLALDPSNPHTVWVGTGENVGGRHTGYGNGIYRSRDDGASWEHLGLEASEHISKIIIHPDDPNTVWVASQGPLWSPGGERGLYKTTDGGETWTNVLSAGEWTGVTDVVIDPRDPDRLYAATWQHHRTVAAYMGAGPESGLHVSDDGGDTWRALSAGLPTGNLGKIGLAISPQNPDVVYAAIEQDRRTGGIWRSDNRGESWENVSDMVSGGTGPHYYQELYASPHAFDRIYLANNTTQISDDGGRTWRAINNENKHVDDHAIAFRADDPDYVLVGSDGGLYESYDNEASWRYIANLPVTQFYKIAADDTEPFYNVYGGTQDNSSQVGPSRTDNMHGIRNSDWEITLFADGHQPAIEPGNPNIAYSQWQQGNLARIDRTNGEVVYIRPQPEPGEPAERYNWDAPILVSSHDPARLFHGSQRLWRSDDRGDTWQSLSGDVTRSQDRMQLEIMGRQWSWDAGWDLYAMSNYNTITSIAESPVDENNLYLGTDDGLIQVSTDGGGSWRQIEAGDLPGVPDTAYVNDIKADLFDADTVYIALDDHKNGDYAPYLLRSTNNGRTWTSMAADLPDGHLVWRIVQDHVNPALLFAATEFGIFFSVDAGDNWVEFTAGAPTISFRDLVIQRRENDLVGGSFGRGIYVLDDYSPLREVSEEALESEALLFAGRRAWWYNEQHPMGFSEGASQGHGLYRAENPPFGAVFTYYLNEGLQTSEEIRQEAEAEMVEAGDGTPFPGFDVIEAERREPAPEIWLTVRDQAGNVVRRVPGAVGAGFHRVSWDLRFPASDAVQGPETNEDDTPFGYMVVPGTYTVELTQRVRGETRMLVGPQSFEVERLNSGALPGASEPEVVAFWERIADMEHRISAARTSIGELEGRFANLRTALHRSRTEPAELDDQFDALRAEYYEIQEALGGNQSSQGRHGSEASTVGSRLSFAQMGTTMSTYGPAPSHVAQLGHAEAELSGILERLDALVSQDLPAFETALRDAGAPWTTWTPLPPQ